MDNPTFSFTTKLWLWTTDKAPASWHFLSIAGEAAEEIQAHAAMARLEMGGGRRRGFGAVKLEAAIGETAWQTSLFPDKDSGGFLLPVKAAVRKAERLALDDEVTVRLALM